VGGGQGKGIGGQGGVRVRGAVAAAWHLGIQACAGLPALHVPSPATHPRPPVGHTLASKPLTSDSSTLPSASTTSRIEPRYMSTLALRSVRYAPGLTSSTARGRGGRGQA
jgi:hypothetical protein